MDYSIILAQVLGLAFLVIGLGVLFQRRFTAEAIENALQNPGCLWLMGVLALLIGAIMVPMQESWAGWEWLPTLIGWLALLKGVLILLFPRSMIALYRRWNRSGMLAFSGFVALVVGIVLVWIGFAL